MECPHVGSAVTPPRVPSDVWPSEPGETGAEVLDLDELEELGRLRRENSDLRKLLTAVKEVATLGLTPEPPGTCPVPPPYPAD